MWIKEEKDIGMQKELLNTRTHTVTMLSLQFIKQYDIKRLRRQITDIFIYAFGFNQSNLQYF